MKVIKKLFKTALILFVLLLVLCAIYVVYIAFDFVIPAIPGFLESLIKTV